VKIALSMLCENPSRRTGLTTLFQEFVAHGLALFPDVRWLIFAGENQPWSVDDPRVDMVRKYPANDRPFARLFADHFCVGPAAKERGADVLFTVGFVPLRAPLPVAMQVFTLHHLRPGGGLRSAYRRAAVSRGVLRAGLIVANSEWTAEQLRRAHPAISAPLLVSPEGLQRGRFHPEPDPPLDEAARRELKLPPQYLLWSSNFYHYKRAELALAAYARLERDLRAAFPLVLIGGDWGGGLMRAKAKAAELGIENDTRFLGWIDDRWLPACYRGARAHVLSTEEETFGRSVLEAMACGCPCVTQRLPVLQEVTGGTALAVDFANAQEAADALRAICLDDALAGRLRREGVTRAGEFSFERLARERIEAVVTMLGRKSG
jgi:glycosyltransferase involved in cell wall biosynthesis